MMPGCLEVGLTVFLLLFATVVFRCINRSSLSDIRGPVSSSFLLGNFLELFQRSVGQTDLESQSLYGDIVHFKGPFGGDQLLVADPKALQRIFNIAPYRYLKHPNHRVVIRLTSGKGVIWAEDEEIHKRHRNILLPGFGGPESRAFLGIFKGYAEAMCAQWMEILGHNTDQKIVLNVASWVSRATLDSIGQAAFDVEFAALKDDAHPLVKVYRNMLHDLVGRPSAKMLVTQAASKYIPIWIRDWMVENGNNPRLRRAREAVRVTTQVAKELVREKVDSLRAGKGSQDILSMLINANMDAEAKNKLSEEEVIAQMRTILFAGHATSANTLNWFIFELARHPKVQSRLRSEIRERETAIHARGDTQFTIADLEAMPYLAAVIKEGLRYRPVGPRIQRVAGFDDILPLSRPIITKSGKSISEVVVPKGTEIIVSIAAYNRNKQLWGEDANEFNPDRWLSGVASRRKSVPIGVYSNLMTFLSGPRACLGWRFAVIEIQAFLVEIFGRFELAMTERAEKIRPGTSIMMTPIVEGESELGAQLPLVVSIAAREETFEDGVFK